MDQKTGKKKNAVLIFSTPKENISRIIDPSFKRTPEPITR